MTGTICRQVRFENHTFAEAGGAVSLTDFNRKFRFIQSHDKEERRDAFLRMIEFKLSPAASQEKLHRAV